MKNWTNLAIGIVVLAILAVLVAGFINGQKEFSDNTHKATNTANTNNTTNTNMNNQLKIEDITLGTGAEATAGANITVNYVGTLENGTKFDSSYDRNQPFTFKLGAGQVIKGWDEGFSGMKVGGKRKLTIPGDWGYGSQGSPPTIPPNATLIFEVELLKVE